MKKEKSLFCIFSIKMDKKAIEMSFAWIFSLIVGAIVIFLAIFIAMNLIESGEYETTTKVSQSLINVLDPLQTSVEQGKTESISLLKQTRIYTACKTNGNFGENQVSISEKSGFSKDWTKKSAPISSINQYIFAEESIEGKEIYFFIMPFKMPFKTADIMIMHTRQYCFVNSPDKILDEIENLARNDEKNMVFVNSKSECSDESIKVCFTNSDCDIIVKSNSGEFDKGTVKKQNKEVEYTGNLIYAAIFSSVNNYECGVKRLMMKVSYLSDIYSEKAKLISGRCNTGLQPEMMILKSLAQNYNDLNDLYIIEAQSKLIEEKNKEAICQLY